MQRPKGERDQFVILKIEVPRQHAMDQVDAGIPRWLYCLSRLWVIGSALGRCTLCLLFLLCLLFSRKQTGKVAPGLSQLFQQSLKLFSCLLAHGSGAGTVHHRAE
jgi:hypothetical protein